MDEDKALEILALYVNEPRQKLPEQARSIVRLCKGTQYTALWYAARQPSSTAAILRLKGAFYIIHPQRIKVSHFRPPEN